MTRPIGTALLQPQHADDAAVRDPVRRAEDAGADIVSPVPARGLAYDLSGPQRWIDWRDAQ